MNNFITFCAVYKDEAPRIRYSLDLASKLFKNMIIVAQKSEDATLQICQEYTPNVIDRKIEPPEVSKDVIMGRLETQWMFYLDADEFPSLATIRMLEMITPSDLFGYDSVSFLRTNYIDGLIIEGGQGIDRQYRMLRKDVRWDCAKQGRLAHIHPLVKKTKMSDLVIYHHRTLDKIKAQTKVWNKYSPSTKTECDKYVKDVEEELCQKKK